MSFIKSAFIATISTLSLAAAAAPQIDCTAKRMDKRKGEYDERKLEGGLSPGGMYSAKLISGDCSFLAQSMYPDSILQVNIRHSTTGDGISTYMGYDPKGYAITSFSQSDGELICMLVCSKK